MRRFAPMLLSLVLAGCASGPDTDALTKSVNERLAQALPAGTVSIVELGRRGSQKDAKAPAGETRRIVYYDARIRLERDFDFGAWDSPGVAGIISALGTGPKGLSGIVAGGNKQGDVVVAHGTALYREDGGQWVGVTSGGHSPATAPAYARNEPEGAAAVLDAMHKIVESTPSSPGSPQRALIEEELKIAYAAIRASIARANDGYAIAAGPEHGQYLRFAQAVADVRGSKTVPLVTRGGEENLQLLREGKVYIALAQADAALQAYEGKGRFAEAGPFPSLRAIGSLYPEPIHVLTRADRGATSVASLKGRRIAIGEVGSASRTTALRILEAHGIGPKDFVPHELSLGDALVALRAGTVDAVVQVIGVPADSVRDAISDVPLRLVPLSADAIASLVASKAGYFAYTIPKGTYPLQAQDARTIATAALLVTGAGLSEGEVGAVTRFVFRKGTDFAARGSAQGVQVSPATAREGLSIPQHLAAVKALDAMK